MRRKRFKGSEELFPDEILLDSRNIPQFDRDQCEGRIEKTISRKSLSFLALFFLTIGLIFAGKVWALQITDGEIYAEKSENNRLRHSLVFAPRGIIYDRNNTPLAWNEPGEENSIAERSYIEKPGFAHILGFVNYPKKDSKGFYYEEKMIGKDGIEKYINNTLEGVNGLKITETNALQKIVGESVLEPPKSGESAVLSIDERVQAKLYERMVALGGEVGFKGGAAVILDIHTGEVLAMTSFPEYDPNVMSSGKDKETINGYLSNKSNPFLNRAVEGLYTPGSIVKPFVAIGALEEKIISPNTQIISTGSISVPNPYNPKAPSIFNDWKAHGAVDMRHALAVSSNVYFYEVGGGFGSQKGLGIEKVEKYLRMFGYGEALTGFFEGEAGTIPNPKWKEENFDGDPWRLGDTYFTSIGQYGSQTSPIQAARAVAAVANGGKLITPSIFKISPGQAVFTKLPVAESTLQVIREGMREGVLSGTAKGLNMPQVAVASKTGTAELGVSKANVNSWNTGFFPYDNPRFAYAIIMESGDRHNTIGALYVMRQLFEWMSENTPEYF